ncbi:MAG: DapH/DapD/GlmU-related protein [Bacteroidales bacterium]|nr:DapH/DapD/GlmU-related protein [Bacteroidales bacterium]
MIREKGMVMKMFRLGNICYKSHIPFIPAIMSRIIRMIYSCELSCTTSIGSGTAFVHNGLGCVVNPNSIIGNNVRILQNVSIAGRGPGNGTPIIEDDVMIGCGACILGGVKIGKGAKIGANAVVLKDVPAGSIAVGIPAKIIIK